MCKNLGNAFSVIRCIILTYWPREGLVLKDGAVLFPSTRATVRTTRTHNYLPDLLHA